MQPWNSKECTEDHTDILICHQRYVINCVSHRDNTLAASTRSNNARSTSQGPPSPNGQFQVFLPTDLIVRYSQGVWIFRQGSRSVISVFGYQGYFRIRDMGRQDFNKAPIRTSGAPSSHQSTAFRFQFQSQFGFGFGFGLIGGRV